MLAFTPLTIASVLWLTSTVSASSRTRGQTPKTAYATYINFAEIDILDGDDGLPPHPLQAQYGKMVYPITSDGNGREQVEAHLNYFEGRYWMYAATWGCGGSIFVYGRLSGINWPQSPTYPPGDYGEDGNCGIKTYSSPDFTNWTLEDFYQPSILVANVTKPVVRYSAVTGEYVMFMGGNGRENFYYATSRLPGGPWSNPPSIMSGSNINHDFDIAIGPDGTHYMLSDVFSNVSTALGVPVWDIWVQQLAPNLTSTVGANGTSVKIRTAEQLRDQGLNLEACGFFYKKPYYYMMFGFTCANCPGYIYYYYSSDPFGPYTDGGVISNDGCGGQNKGANVLPSTEGPIVLAGNLGYRTSPNNYVYNGKIWHADNHQAASSTFFFPIEFNEDHTIRSFTCPSTVKIPLPENVTASPDTPVPYQLDCRIRNWQQVVQTFDPPKAISMLEFPVWQRTDNLGPTTNAGPVLDGPLTVSIESSEGLMSNFSWVPSNISWAPQKITMIVKERSVSKITLTTNATNGCYGTIVEPKTDVGSEYGTVVQGKMVDSHKAQLYVYSG